MKQLKRSIQIIILSMAVMLTCKFNVFAAGNSISFSDPTAKKGEAVTVTLKVTSDSTALGAVDLNIVYDDSALEFTGGGSSVKGGSGSVRIADTASDSSSKTMTYQLNFKALKAGKSSLTVSNYEVYGFDESVVSMDHVGSSSVEITDDTAALSKDASLKELKISEGTLSPTFSPSVMNYTASVGADVTSVVVSGTTTNGKAGITSITGSDNLKPGENVVKVSVTAESGATAVYTITITKAGSTAQTAASTNVTAAPTATVAAEATTAPEMTVAAETTGTPETTGTAETTGAPETTGTPETTGAAEEYIKIGDRLLTPLALPADAELKGYTKGTLEYNNTTIEALVSDYMEVYVLYMVDTNGNEDYYVYYREIGEFTEFIKIDNGGDKFIVVLDGYPRDISIYGFERTTIMINDKKVGIAWKYTDELIQYSSAAAEYYLVGGLSESGVATWYVYDFVQGTYQRYFVQPANLIEEETGPDLTLTEQEQQVKELNEALQKSKNSRLMVIGVLAFIALFLLIATINLILKVRILQGEIDDLEAELEEAPKSKKETRAVPPVQKQVPPKRVPEKKQVPERKQPSEKQQVSEKRGMPEKRVVPKKKNQPEEDFFDEEDMIPREMEDAIIKEKMLGRGMEEDEFEESFKVRRTKPTPQKTTSQKPVSQKSETKKAAPQKSAPQKPVAKKAEKKIDDDDFDFEFIDLDDK